MFRAPSVSALIEEGKFCFMDSSISSFSAPEFKDFSFFRSNESSSPPRFFTLFSISIIFSAVFCSSQLDSVLPCSQRFVAKCFLRCFHWHCSYLDYSDRVEECFDLYLNLNMLCYLIIITCHQCILFNIR